jgi:glycosyltransferase involved in cell wall biosynthesis
MPPQKLVSVIIPAYNAEQFIEEAIESALRQTYSHREVIVVDDGSLDDTKERVSKYASDVVYVWQRNSGGFPGSPRNRGLELSRGEFLCFLDADDIMLSDRIQRQVELLEANPDLGFVFGDYRNFSDRGQAERTHFEECPQLQRLLGQQGYLVLPSSSATMLLLHENIGLPSSLMLRREVLRSIQCFSTKFRIGEDFHFCYQIAREFGMGVINQIVSLRRLHGDNLTGDSLRTLHDHVDCYSLLMESEGNVRNAVMLDGMLFQCELDLARAYADRREYWHSVVHNMRAIKSGSFNGVQRLGRAMRSLVRTAAIVAHIKSPAS